MTEIERRWFIGATITDIELRENETTIFIEKDHLEHSMIISGTVKNIFDLTEQINIED